MQLHFSSVLPGVQVGEVTNEYIQILPVHLFLLFLGVILVPILLACCLIRRLLLNSQYRRTNSELARLHNISGVLAEVSTRFINLPVNRINTEVPVALGRIANAIGVQRASILLLEEDRRFASLHWEWSAPGVDPVPEFFYRVDMALFEWFHSCVISGTSMVISDLNTDLPPEATTEREVYKSMDWKSVATIPLTVEGEAIGFVSFTTVDQSHDWPANIIDDLAVAGQVFANAFERRDRTKAMRALRQDAVDAEERERTRISRELHDQFGGTLTGLRIHSRNLQDQLSDKPKLAGVATRMTEIIDDTMPEIRRICSELRPALLEELAIEDAIEQLAVRFTQNTDITCRFDLQYLNPLAADRTRDVTLYRITQELLTNVSRHSGATEVTVSLSRNAENETVSLSVSDNGSGFDYEKVKNKTNHFGLRGVAERIELINGKLSFGDNTTGTLVEVTIPEAQPED